MTFLGIDQSLNAAGVCRIREDASVDAVATIVPKGMSDGVRLVHIKTAIAALLGDVTYVAMEGYSYDSINKPFLLGELGGVVKVLLIEQKVTYIVVPPVLLKKYATGSTTAKKEHIIEAAAAAGMSTDDDNQADAFFLARIARSCATGTTNYRYELEVVHALLHPTEKRPRRRVRQLVKAAL